MSKKVQYLECCGRRNEAITHQLSADNWFQDRQIDFAVCKNCGSLLLQRRYVSVNGEAVNPPFMCGRTQKGKERIMDAYNKLLECELERFDNEFIKSQAYGGGLMRNLYHSRKGVEYRSDGIAALTDGRMRKYEDGCWKQKVRGRYRDISISQSVIIV